MACNVHSLWQVGYTPASATPTPQVRELVKAAGLDLTSLKRVRIGGFRLPADLGLGGYRWAGRGAGRGMGTVVLQCCVCWVGPSRVMPAASGRTRRVQ